MLCIFKILFESKSKVYKYVSEAKLYFLRINNSLETFTFLTLLVKLFIQNFVKNVYLKTITWKIFNRLKTFFYKTNPKSVYCKEIYTRRNNICITAWLGLNQPYSESCTSAPLVKVNSTYMKHKVWPCQPAAPASPVECLL